MLNKEKRAKIFLSYDSLKGFKDFIQEKEKIKVDRKQLSIDTYDELNWKIKQIQIGKIIKVIYFDQNDYIVLEGMVSKIDLQNKKEIMIVNQSIFINDIVQISGEGIDE